MTEKKRKSGPTRAQLEAENARLKARIEKLSVGDSLRFEGENWFEIVEYFDARQIKRIPATAGIERAYLVGMIEDVWVIEVPKTTPSEDIHAFNAQLRAMGITAPFLTVTSDVRFLKLGRVPEDVEVELDRAEVKAFGDAVRERAELVAKAMEEKQHDEAQAALTVPGHCPECGEPGFGEHGCVYCGHGRRATVDAGAGPEPDGDGLGGAGLADAGGVGDRGDSDGEGEAVRTPPVG